MSYYSNVAVAFLKNDWKKEIYPKLLNELADELPLFNQAEEVSDGKYIGFRWTDINHWDDGKLASFLNDVVDKYPSDFFKLGENYPDNKNALTIHRELYFISIYTTYARFSPETNVSEIDIIATNLVRALLEKGLSKDEIIAIGGKSTDGYPYSGMVSQVKKYCNDVLKEKSASKKSQNHTEKMDYVECQECGWIGAVKHNEETCPHCHKKGHLTYEYSNPDYQHATKKRIGQDMLYHVLNYLPVNESNMIEESYSTFPVGTPLSKVISSIYKEYGKMEPKEI